uniref:Uncharacterized protein n=1 Tax=Vitrella brassicaformis TaxID=1169539 RepID=A0A7S1KHS1_9ALVE|mmetsp:Transcript_6081/g.14617  ORF Transcript_6081/g.14617 Transcript_6081/m.14617 type:complete len:107 (+) Transcript_6081:1045-1365(+)
MQKAKRVMSELTEDYGKKTIDQATVKLDVLKYSSLCLSHQLMNGGIVASLGTPTASPAPPLYKQHEPTQQAKSAKQHTHRDTIGVHYPDPLPRHPTNRSPYQTPAQ